MALTAQNVRVAVTGGVYFVEGGSSSLPTDATAALDPSITAQELGYLSEDGIVQSIGSDTTDIKAWQGGDTIRTVQTSHTLTYQLTLLETSDKTLNVYYGDPVEVKAVAGVRGSWVVHIVDGGTKVRIVLPDAQVTDRGDVSFVNGDPISYPVTVTAYPDTSGVKAYVYQDAGASS